MYHLWYHVRNIAHCAICALFELIAKILAGLKDFIGAALFLAFAFVAADAANGGPGIHVLQLVGWIVFIVGMLIGIFWDQLQWPEGR